MFVCENTNYLYLIETALNVLLKSIQFHLNIYFVNSIYKTILKPRAFLKLQIYKF